MDRPHLPPTPVERPIIDEAGPVLITPITRRGTGPGLLLLVDDASSGLFIDNGVPSPLQKWGEEGYSVVEITASKLEHYGPAAVLQAATQALTTSETCQPKGVVGVVAYDAMLWNAIAANLSDNADVVAAVVYSDATSIDNLAPSHIPVLVHAAGKVERKLIRDEKKIEHEYATRPSAFASPRLAGFDYATEAVSHTRSLTHLKKLMNGPYFDLETIWDEHTYWEFEKRDVEATMNTMVAEPYVNHIPTLTGGIGRKDLTDFYQNHFVFSNPRDTELEVISRTVGIDRVVDEFIMKMTHDTMVDWLFPGVPATHKRVEVPFMAVVNVRGDRLYHEHIHWDQATALRQIGLIPDALPAAAGVNGVLAAHTEQVMVLPVGGSETAAKLRDKNAVASNAMFTEAGPRSTTM